MTKLRFGLLIVLVLVALAAAGCGEKKSSETAVKTLPTVMPSPTVDPNRPTDTPRPTNTPGPPTWTPPPSVAPPTPHPTIGVTMDRPTETMVMLPSRTPTPVPPTPTPPGPLLTMTADMIAQVLNEELQVGAGGLFTLPLQVSLQDGIILVTINVLTTPGDVNTAREVVIQASLAPVEGRAKVSLVRATYTSDNAIYDTDLDDNLLSTLETKIGGLVIQLYNAAAGSSQFYISEIAIASTGITFQTVTKPE